MGTKVKDIEVRHPLNYDAAAWSNADTIKDFGPTKCQQNQAEDTNINVIVKRFSKTGQLPEGYRRPMYGDFTEVKDLRQSLEQIRDAETRFMQLPAEIRYQFDNDLSTFLAWAEKPENLDELRRLALEPPEPIVSPEGELLGTKPVPTEHDPRSTPKSPTAPQPGGPNSPPQTPPGSGGPPGK